MVQAEHCRGSWLNASLILYSSLGVWEKRTGALLLPPHPAETALHFRRMRRPAKASWTTRCQGPAKGAITPVRCRRPDVILGRLGGERGIWVVDGSLHGRRRERERRGQGQAFVVHVVYGNRTQGEASLAVSRGRRVAAAVSQRLVTTGGLEK